MSRLFLYTGLAAADFVVYRVLVAASCSEPNTITTASCLSEPHWPIAQGLIALYFAILCFIEYNHNKDYRG